jgi:hypothetical protein
MYQPKIREDLIPRLYRLAKARRIPMTRLVSELLEEVLGQLEWEAVHDPQAEDYRPTVKPHTKGGDE